MSKVTSNQAKPEDREKLLQDLEAAKPVEPTVEDLIKPVEEPQTPPVEEPVAPEPPVTPPVEEPVTPPAEDEIARLKREKEEAEAKFSASTREAQKLSMRDRIYNENIEKAKELPLPTDDDMRTEYGDDWDTLDSVTQKIAIESLHQKQKLALIESVNDRLTNEQAQVSKVRSYAADPDVIKSFPVIDGREDEFEKFALKPSRQGMDLEDVAALFNAATAAQNQAKKPGIPAMFTPNHGSSTVPITPNHSVDANKSGFMRKKTNKNWQQQIRDKKIKPADLLK